VGGDAGTYHLQGYVEFERAVRLAHLTKALPGAHFEVRRGTQAEAIEYCEKQDETHVGGPYRFGEPTRGQGSRSDLIEVQKAVRAGKRKIELFEEHFPTMVKYHRGVEEYMGLRQVRRSTRPSVFVFFGGTGVGKSRTARVIGEYVAGSVEGVYFVPPPKSSGLYWDNYDAHKVVVFEEFHGGYMTPTFFNQMCDFNPFDVPRHGSRGVPFVASLIIITTNISPRAWWQKGHRAAWMRRLDWCVFFGTLPRRPQNVAPVPNVAPIFLARSRNLRVASPGPNEAGAF